MLMGKPRPQQNTMGMSQDPRQLFSPLRKAGIAADALVLRGYGTGQQLREQGLQEAQFEMAQNQRADTIKALQQRAAAGDKIAEKVLMAVQNRSLTPSDAMKIYYREKFAKPDTTFSMKKGSELGMTGENANKFFNVGTDGSVKSIGGGGINITNKLGEEKGKLMLNKGYEATEKIYNAYTAAQKTLENIQLQKSLMNNSDFRSGFGAEAIAQVQKLFETLGFGNANVSSMENFRATSRQQVLDRLGGSLGVGVSGSDVDFMLGMVASLDMTKEGISEFLMIQELISEGEKRAFDFTNDYIARQDAALVANGQEPLGFVAHPLIFQRELAQHIDSLPSLFAE